MKKILAISVIFVVLLVSYKLLSKPPIMTGVSDNEAELILFWGDGCPHCKIVEDYIGSNKVKDKIKIAYKEVYYNKTNQNLLMETVKKCPEINSSNGVGVPLAFDKVNSKCIYGDQPIIDWIKAKMLK